MIMRPNQNETPASGRIFWGVAFGWSILILLLGVYNGHQAYRTARQMAYAAALDSWKKDYILRLWAARHGGVYVPATSDTPPNPYLAHVPERDIVSPSGQSLTLINPAYMTRQVHEMGRDEFGFRGHITSLNPIRPENAPDMWEAKALQSFLQGTPEMTSFDDLEGERHLRFMRPLQTEAECLKCHAVQGYRLGDVRGGISVSIPWQPYRSEFHRQIMGIVFAYALVMVLGLGTIALARRHMKRFFQEREAAAAVLSRERKLLQDVLDCAPDFLILKDCQGVYQKVNSAFCRFLDMPESRVVGKTVHDLFPKEDAEEYFRQDQRVMETRESEIKDRLVVGAHGKTWMNVIKSPVVDQDGQVTGVLCSVRDISDRKQMELSLQTSEQRFRLAFENGQDAIIWADAETGMILDCNRSATELFETTRDALVGIHQSMLHPKEKEAYFRQMFSDHARGQKIADEADIITANGKVKTVTICKATSQIGDRAVIQGVFRDISSRKELEETLIQSDRRLHLALESAKAGIWEWDVRTGQNYWSDEIWKLYDLDPFCCDSSYETWRQAIYPEDRSSVEQTVQTATGSAKELNAEWRVNTTDGSIRWLMSRGSPIADAQGNIVRYCGTVMDITDRKRAEEKLLFQMAFSQAILDSMYAHLVVLDRDGNILMVNRAWQRFAAENGGADESAWGVGANYYQVCRKEAGADSTGWRAMEGIRKIQAGLASEFSLEYPCHCPTQERWFVMRILPLLGRTGEVLISHSDITARYQAETAMRKSLKEKNVLLQEIHHRVKNNLQIVASLVGLQASRSGNPEVTAMLQDTRNRIRSMSLLHETLYRSDNFAGLNLNAYVAQLCADIMASVGTGTPRIRLEHRIAAIDLPLDLAVPFGLIISELVSNSVKYAFPGDRSGRIEVALEPGYPDENLLILRVRDDGVGLPENFDPEQTTSLGLQLVHNLAIQLGGSLSISGGETGGVRVMVTFPRDGYGEKDEG